MTVNLTSLQVAQANTASAQKTTTKVLQQRDKYKAQAASRWKGRTVAILSFCAIGFFVLSILLIRDNRTSHNTFTADICDPLPDDVADQFGELFNLLPKQ